MNLSIKSLEPTLLEDFLHFFDNIGFVDNPGWSVCYCQFYQNDLTNKEWARRSKEQNREDARKAILNELMHGFVAYADNNPVGWVNADLKENYPKFKLIEELKDEFDGKLASIVCFLVDPSQRKKGIATKLLSHVCNELKEQKYDCIEAYPRTGVSSDAQNYHGPLSMYLSQGFEVHKEYDRLTIVRKYL